MDVMKRQLKVLVCDDEPKSANSLSKKLGKFSFLQSTSIAESTLMAQLSVLGDRLEASRKPALNKSKLSDLKSDFDEIDILVVDYDLIGMRKAGVITGEEVAYLVRCYSTCKVIVAVNQFFRESTFDLTLRGHFESFADVNISAEDLGSESLWEGIGTGFHPWYWPRLSTLVDQMNARAAQVTAGPASTFDLIGLSAELAPTMSTDVLSAVWDGKRPLSVDEFIESHGVRGVDRIYPAARGLIVASRLGKWVRTLLSAGQDIVVDAPHLVERCPSLLTSVRPTLDICNKTTSRALTAMGIRHALLQSHQIIGHWTTVPMWSWLSLENDRKVQEKVPELAEPWSRKVLPYVFCEDTSVFRTKSKTRTFVADLRSGYSRRALQHVAGVNYRPELRLAM